MRTDGESAAERLTRRVASIQRRAPEQAGGGEAIPLESDQDRARVCLQ
jgi:hypothetical protein